MLDAAEALLERNKSSSFSRHQFGPDRAEARRPVTIVGGGNSAGQAAVFLARQAAAVNQVIRHDDLYRDMSRYLADRVLHT